MQRASDIIVNLHELWALPCQIVIAFALLYLQVNVAFFAGIFIIMIMTPINRWIAVRIGRATEQLMAHKDARVKLVTECIRGMKSIKMSGLEDAMSDLSMAHREQEVLYLSRRKYLDAWCVFLWAAMPLLVPYVTFVTTVAVLNRNLTASEVFTTIALLNMLIFPMNAFPWIINGLVEATVSIRRLSLLLVVPEGSPTDVAGSDTGDLTSSPGSGHDRQLSCRKRLLLDLGYVYGEAYDVSSVEFADQGRKLGPRGIYSPLVIIPPPVHPHCNSSFGVSTCPLFAGASFIVARDVTASWNLSELQRLERRLIDSARSLADVRRIYSQRVLKDMTFAVGPFTLTGVYGGTVSVIMVWCDTLMTVSRCASLGDCSVRLCWIRQEHFAPRLASRMLHLLTKSHVDGAWSGLYPHNRVVLPSKSSHACRHREVQCVLRISLCL